jgi:hypothetical protein
MLVYVNCVMADTEYTVAINPQHVVSITEIKSDIVESNVLITVTTGREYFSKENYLELVAKFSGCL